MFVISPLDRPLTELSTEELAGEITTLYSRISAETCRWLQLVAEYDKRNAFRDEWGARHMADWLSWHCGVGIRAAHEQIRVARCLDELPLTTDAFAKGELSYSKVRAISRVADKHTEASLVGLARDATAAQMERIASSYRRARVISAEDEVTRERYATWDQAEDGSLRLRACLSPEEGAIVKKALEVARNEIHGERDDECHDAEHERRNARPELRVTNADALVRMAESLLAGPDGKATGGDATQVVVHVDLDALGENPGQDCRCEVEGSIGISPSAAQRLACDASVVTMIERGGEPLSVGRKTRSVSPAIRRAMQARDGAAAFPVVPPIGSSTPITSSTGSRVARRVSKTS